MFIFQDFGVHDWAARLPSATFAFIMAALIYLHMRRFRPGAPLLLGDGLRLRQVLTNLFSNAIKFTEEGYIRFGVSSSRMEQMVRIALFNGASSEVNNAMRVIFTLEDSGIGMNQEQIAQLFDEFSQADASTTRKFGGTGLGMAITSKLVKLMGGKIDVNSQLGKGSCFAVEIPFEVALFAETPLKERRKKMSNDDSLRGLRVLVAEDNPVNRLLAVELLAMKGVEAEIAENGREGIDKLQKLPSDFFKAVLMDLQMPVLDGYEASRIIRDDPKFDKLPIIVLSAHAINSEKNRFNQIGINGYITKPFDPEELWHTLLRAIGKSESPLGGLPLQSYPTDPEIVINGVNVHAGIKGAGGSHILYAKVIQETLNTYASGCNTLLEFAKHQQKERGLAYAHTLKGVFGSIGAEAMQNAMASIEDTFKAGADPYEQILALEESYAACMADLRGFINAAGTHKSEEKAVQKGNSGSDAAWLEQFRTFLERGDFEAVALWENNRGTLTGRLSPNVAIEISKAIRNFDFALALEHLDTDKIEQ